MSISIDTSGLSSIAGRLEHAADAEPEIRAAARDGALEKFKSARVPTRTGELERSKFVRDAGDGFEAGYDSAHLSRRAQREAILPSAIELADAATGAAQDKVAEVLE